MASISVMEAQVRFEEGSPAQRAAFALASPTGNGGGLCIGLMGLVVPPGASQAEQDAARRQWREYCDLRAMMMRMDQNLATVVRNDYELRRENQELRTVKERLERMQGEKLFAFTNGIDEASFRIFCAVLANGDVAKASRALNMNDATLRSRVASWKNGGPAYQVLIELVRWRKAMGRKETVPLPEAILKNTAARTDFVGLLSDVLDEVLEMNGRNWEEKAEALAALLRPYVPR